MTHVVSYGRFIFRRFRNLWTSLRSSLWFVPLISVAVAIALAIGLTGLDVALGRDWFAGESLLFGVGVDGARGMLTAIAGSMMTVAGLTFSLTISTLATASSQYTSRLVRNFMRDTFNQFVLGYFVGLFAYCLIVLRTIRGGSDGQFVPSIAVFAGLLLALVSIAVLILFIHHIAASIQASVILSRVTSETIQAVKHMFPKDVGEPAGDADVSDQTLKSGMRWQSIESASMGYVQHVDADALLELAVKHDAVIRMKADIGSFVTPHGLLCEVALPRHIDKKLADAVRATYFIGSTRTIEQDPAYGVRQIVDIALRALSPGVNDTTTGVMCVEHLAAIIEAAGSQEMPEEYRAEDGALRIIAKARSFEALLALALDQIRQVSGINVAVQVALLRSLAVSARRTGTADRRALLRRHGKLIEEQSRERLTFDYDKQTIQTNLDALWLELDKGPAASAGDSQSFEK